MGKMILSNDLWEGCKPGRLPCGAGQRRGALAKGPASPWPRTTLSVSSPWVSYEDLERLVVEADLAEKRPHGRPEFTNIGAKPSAAALALIKPPSASLCAPT